jgi:hypothetical protein
MDMTDSRQMIADVFHRLRAEDFNLGVGELLDALRLVEAGWSLARLRGDLALLWCHSVEQTGAFDEAWRRASVEAAPAAPAPDRPVAPPVARPPARRDAPPLEAEAPPAPAAVDPSILPVPPPAAPRDDARGSLQAAWPISRETMAYGWRALRQTQADGPLDVLDMEATIERAARLGFFPGAVYRRRPSSRAHLLLLVDQGGSMAPFHRFTRDLVETARGERMLARVGVWYFHNHFSDNLYRDPHLGEPVSCAEALDETDAETSILIVSDAGAARGHRRRKRIRGAAVMLAALDARSHRIAWLNPMPRARWLASSAEVIAHLVKTMFPMDADGFSNAIDAARGITQSAWSAEA